MNKKEYLELCNGFIKKEAQEKYKDLFEEMYKEFKEILDVLDNGSAAICENEQELVDKARANIRKKINDTVDE